ncbi:hypothetical protein JS528_00870 [Bifidobacterium sp. MA2]|uniref:Uncharacterized protein n=1 Tax=Bifidobacterium santillanense TaxID=2809028 RepID=A0ABS5UM03_9BIFI|nr:hypothetical protein [Bifidobacterium santillanense]MBT1171931.1 hypothetical protein [Bifidobacterium santillanense]
MESTFAIIDMLPTYGLLCYAVLSVCVAVAFRTLNRTDGERCHPRAAVVALLIGSAAVALFAYAAYVIAMPYAQPDMVDFYHTYQPVVPLFLTGCFAVQFVFGVAAATGWRGRRK